MWGFPFSSWITRYLVSDDWTLLLTNFTAFFTLFIAIIISNIFFEPKNKLAF